MRKRVICPKCNKPALDRRQYKDGSALYVHEQKTIKTPFGSSDEITKYCEVKESRPRRVTVSASAPATRLRELADKLSDNERWCLVNRLAYGDRLAIFHIDGETVRLGEPAIVGSGELVRA